MFLLFQGCIFRFRVSFQGCTPLKFNSSPLKMGPRNQRQSTWDQPSFLREELLVFRGVSPAFSEKSSDLQKINPNGSSLRVQSSISTGCLVDMAGYLDHSQHQFFTEEKQKKSGFRVEIYVDSHLVSLISVSTLSVSDQIVSRNLYLTIP